MADFKRKLRSELTALAGAMLYFGCWIGVLLVLKKLLLAEYHIKVYGWSAILVGTLVLSKVVLLLEHVPLGRRVRAGPAWIDIALRTALYSVGVLIVLLLEHGIREWREHGRFKIVLAHDGEQADANHLWANAICIVGSLLVYNVLAVIRRHLGEGVLLKVFLHPRADASDRSHARPPRS